ncbi:unnamed protein product [Moneuplotes crassus]|uniref:Uncharacterized protein n=1 Tax=Euplotes crassus TaxID=5936 RepID=A0AAD1UQE7_EUPCR|nr:unnamed protein product [Moneuplotes crassus]
MSEQAYYSKLEDSVATKTITNQNSFNSFMKAMMKKVDPDYKKSKNNLTKDILKTEFKNLKKSLGLPKSSKAEVCITFDQLMNYYNGVNEPSKRLEQIKSLFKKILKKEFKKMRENGYIQRMLKAVYTKELIEQAQIGIETLANESQEYFSVHRPNTEQFRGFNSDPNEISDIKNEVTKLTEMVKGLSENKPQDNFSEFKPRQTPSNHDQRVDFDTSGSFFSYRNSHFSNPQTQDFLTNRVWPKTRILLALASRMYKENVITLEQRGKLKDLIIAADIRLQAALNEYYIDGNRAILYRNLVCLI